MGEAGKDCDDSCDHGADDVGQGLRVAKADAEVVALEANDADRNEESEELPPA